MNLKRFEDVHANLLVEVSKGHRDHAVTVEEAIQAYAGGRHLLTDDGQHEMTTSAADQLFQKVGLPAKVLGYFDNDPDLQVAMVQHKLATLSEEQKQKSIICRGAATKDGNIRYEAFLSSDYIPISNFSLLNALGQVFDDIGLEAMVHKFHYRNRMMAMRIVAPTWEYDLAVSGGHDTAWAGLSITNDELGLSKVVISAALARVACFNYTVVDKPLFEHAHRFLNPQEVFQGLRDGVIALQSVSENVSNQLRLLHDVDVQDVAGMVSAIGTQLSLPKYVQDASLDWWKENGSVPSMFAVVQAIERGADKFTERKGFHWQRRELVETQMYNMANSYLENGRLELCECPKCHRPLIGDDSVVDAEYVLQ